jgi:hypothetical protein
LSARRNLRFALDVDLGLVGLRKAQRGVDAPLVRALTLYRIGERLPCEGSVANHHEGQYGKCFKFHRSSSRSDVSPFSLANALRDVSVWLLILPLNGGSLPRRLLA